eukprot:CAMPEP_0118661122 /NCGR_PEP_ID=MMETSP0785-20121206/16100_1 /TAXON_ID=91992 /ORGANISM="Bolidomonas pacifica, Strain CCMP 1866" /LENGTH=79 /DNA_ID=CAMNT_0006554519 /DNA_START=264 /DNA_END=503 /DNA_ORIENTATION=+
MLPDARPPPPTGITTASRVNSRPLRDRSWDISSWHTVPCPAITIGFSDGCTNTAPGVDDIIPSAVDCLSFGGQKVTLAL